MLNQAASDRGQLAKLLNISNEQMSYITNADAGCGLIKYGSALVPFINRFPQNTKLYQLSAGTIRQWILRKELRSTRIPCGIQVTAKEWLIDFTVRYTIKNPSRLSITHRELVEQHFCDCSQKCN